MSTIMAIFLAHWKTLLWGGFVLVSAVIVILGGLKKLVFDRIHNKLVRKVLLAFTSIALAFAATAIAFWVKGFEFKLYPIAGATVSVATIVIYWFYENTGLRNFIHFVGNNTVVKFIKALAKAITDNEKDPEELKQDLKEIPEQVYPADENLKNL